jgi:selenocysteine lyase/cysteine desulfurase
MELTKRDFLKTSGWAALGYALKSARPAAALGAEFRAAFHRIERAGNPEWERIRDEFPLTRERVYFNNGTLGPSPKRVLDAVATAMSRVETTGESFETEDSALREKLAAFVGASAAEISLTRNTSDGVNIVAQGLRLEAGDEIVITTHEHVGNALPWLNRARLSGVVLRSFAPPRTAVEVLTAIESRLGPRTRVIAIPHLSCTTGQVFPIAEIVKLAEARGVLVAVDGAHGTGMLPLALGRLGVHFYASSAHKWLCGPKGVGYLYVRRDLLDRLEPIFVGAYSDSGWTLDSVPPRIDGWNPTAHRFDFGTQNTALYAGTSAAIDFFTAIGPARITAHGLALAKDLQSALLARADAIEMLTPTEDRSRGMMVSFRFRDPTKDYREFGAFATARGFRVRLVAEAGLGAVRVSTHLYNSGAEVEAFVAVVGEFLARNR